MSETVYIALITFASSLVGAGIGAFTAYGVAKISASAERKKMINTERIRAYSNLMTAYGNFILNMTADCNEDSLLSERERLIYTQFQNAYSTAVLVAPRSVVPALNDLFLSINKFGETRQIPDNLGRLYQIAVDKMREDVLSKK